MRIVKADVAKVAAPFPRPLRFAPRPMTTNTAVVVHLEEASGSVGLGYAPTLGFGTEALRSHISDDFVPRILRAELQSVEEAVAMLVEAAGISGRVSGSARQAISVLEMALLDVASQLVNLPLHKLWCQPTGHARAYASGGWRYLSTAELTKFALRSALDGFEAVKMQVGLNPSEDATRLRAVREAVGPELDIMLDANGRIPLDLATEWLSALAPYCPAWLEEPLPASDHVSLAKLCRASTIPIAAGEGETEPSEVWDLLTKKAVDVIQPDIYRVGLGAARETRDRASLAQIAVAPHMAHEVSSHLLSGVAGEGWLEYFDWFEDWWEVPVVPRSGRLTPSTVPGHGLRLRARWLAAHRL